MPCSFSHDQLRETFSLSLSFHISKGASWSQFSSVCPVHFGSLCSTLWVQNILIKDGVYLILFKVLLSQKHLSIQ